MRYLHDVPQFEKETVGNFNLCVSLLNMTSVVLICPVNINIVTSKENYLIFKYVIEFKLEFRQTLSYKHYPLHYIIFL